MPIIGRSLPTRAAMRDHRDCPCAKQAEGRFAVVGACCCQKAAFNNQLATDRRPDVLWHAGTDESIGCITTGKDQQMAAVQPMRLIVEEATSNARDDALESLPDSVFAQQADRYALQVCRAAHACHIPVAKSTRGCKAAAPRTEHKLVGKTVLNPTADDDIMLVGLPASGGVMMWAYCPSQS